jgi:uncharacterized protein (TIGR04442 family)
MISDLRLHGSIGPVEFFVFVSGAGSFNTYFYEVTQEGIRFFSRGNEFSIGVEGIYFKGTGGSFCEYMFGVEKPFKDMMKKGVANRLVMFGAYLNEEENVIFTNGIEGRESYHHLFLQGHAVKNYYFIVSSDLKGEYRKRQKQILGSVGKFLKRTSLIAEDMDTQLLAGFGSALNEENSTIYVFKLVHRANRQFNDSFQEFYSKERALSADEERFLEETALRHGIDRYQQERMKVDIMYRHPENRRVVDEYREILLAGVPGAAIPPAAHARLRRLRTLAIRNNIPAALFETLDELLLKSSDQETGEPEYLKDTNAILQGLFFKDPSLKRHIIKDDIVRLIRAKKDADLSGDKGFEQILLDTVRICDEVVRETNDFKTFEELTSIVTYFDRYDNIYSLLNQIAFMEEAVLGEDALRSLIGNKKEFDALDTKLFEQMFTQELSGNKYVTFYGRKKLSVLMKGMKKIGAGDASLKDIVSDLKALAEEEKLYKMIRGALKDRIRSFFPGLNTRKGRGKMREEIGRELAEKGVVDMPAKLFDKVFVDLGKESFYLNQLLPAVLRNRDAGLREDFFANSGLDRFYVESLEKKYFESRKIAPGVLEPLLFGGGERI